MATVAFRQRPILDFCSGIGRFFCTPMPRMRLYVERISEKNRELRRILENFGEGPLEKNPCLAFSSYFCTRRRYKAKTGMVLAYLESSPYFLLL